MVWYLVKHRGNFAFILLHSIFSVTIACLEGDTPDHVICSDRG